MLRQRQAQGATASAVLTPQFSHRRNTALKDFFFLSVKEGKTCKGLDSFRTLNTNTVGPLFSPELGTGLQASAALLLKLRGGHSPLFPGKIQSFPL